MKYWERSIESFSDEIICRPPRKSVNPPDGGVWFYCGFDIGPVKWPSDPDFGYAGCGKTLEDAVKSMANAIRSGWDSQKRIHSRCLRWWRMKELGLDELPQVVGWFETLDYSKVYSEFMDFEVPDEYDGLDYLR